MKCRIKESRSKSSLSMQEIGQGVTANNAHIHVHSHLTVFVLKDGKSLPNESYFFSVYKISATMGEKFI